MFDFLKSKVAKIVMWTVLVVDLALLILAGATKDQVNGIVVLVFSAVAAVILVVQAVIKLINDNDKESEAAEN